jgi:HlyD family secretion protein
MLQSPADPGRSRSPDAVSRVQEDGHVTDVPKRHPKLAELAIDDGAREAAGNRRWLLVALVAITIVAAGAAVLALRGPGAIAVSTTTARPAEAAAIATVLNASGYVEPRRKATVAAKITGRVTEVLVDEGMAVEEGQVLARLDDVDARRRADATRANRDVAHAALDEIEVNLADAERRLRRTRELYADGVASEQDLDSATAAADALRAQLAVARRSLDAAEAELAVAVQDLDNFTIRAPFAGIAVSKDAQPGEMVSPISAGGGFTRTGISTIVDMSSLEIEVDVNESSISKVVPGQPALATLDAYPTWQIPATVRTVIPTADRQKATVKVRLTFDQLDPRILPDMGVKVAFQQSAAEAEAGSPALCLVPRRAVRNDDGQPVVFQLRDGAAERRAVTLGRDFGADVEVVAGLAAGATVILDPPPELEDGAAVTVTG